MPTMATRKTTPVRPPSKPELKEAGKGLNNPKDLSPKQVALKLTRFGGALQAFIGGFTDAEDTSALFA
jgi:hypothetical protein